MFKIKIKILINQCFQTELLKTVEDISFIEFVSMNENNIYKISNKNNNENNNDLETIAGPLFVDDMIFKTNYNIYKFISKIKIQSQIINYNFTIYNVDAVIKDQNINLFVANFIKQMNYEKYIYPCEITFTNNDNKFYINSITKHNVFNFKLNEIEINQLPLLLKIKNQRSIIYTIAIFDYMIKTYNNNIDILFMDGSKIQPEEIKQFMKQNLLKEIYSLLY